MQEAAAVERRQQQQRLHAGLVGAVGEQQTSAGVRGRGRLKQRGNEVRAKAEAVLAHRRTQTATETVGERRPQVRAGAAAVA